MHFRYQYSCAVPVSEVYQGPRILGKKQIILQVIMADLVSSVGGVKKLNTTNYKYRIAHMYPVLSEGTGPMVTYWHYKDHTS